MIFYGDSVVGKIRKVNEDSCVVKAVNEKCILAVVADGMGGHRGGKEASSMALKYICEYVENSVNSLKKQSKTKIRNLLESAANKANSEILKFSESDGSLRGMGTTIVVCLIVNNCYYTVSAGDSRMYMQSSEFTQITRDHSYVTELVEMGLITPQEAKTHPNKNIITRALGTEKTVEYDFYTGEFNAGDIIMLCSDGLTNMVSDEEISKILRKNDTPENKVGILLDNANNHGGTDNISVVLIENNEKGGAGK